MTLMEARFSKPGLNEPYECPKNAKAARKGRARAAFDGLECSVVRMSLCFRFRDGITLD